MLSRRKAPDALGAGHAPDTRFVTVPDGLGGSRCKSRSALPFRVPRPGLSTVSGAPGLRVPRRLGSRGCAGRAETRRRAASRPAPRRPGRRILPDRGANEASRGPRPRRLALRPTAREVARPKTRSPPRAAPSRRSGLVALRRPRPPSRRAGTPAPEGERGRQTRAASTTSSEKPCRRAGRGIAPPPNRRAPTPPRDPRTAPRNPPPLARRCHCARRPSRRPTIGSKTTADPREGECVVRPATPGRRHRQRRTRRSAVGKSSAEAPVFPFEIRLSETPPRPRSHPRKGCPPPPWPSRSHRFRRQRVQVNPDRNRRHGKQKLLLRQTNLCISRQAREY